MLSLLLSLLFSLSFVHRHPHVRSSPLSELDALMALKASLDPDGQVLTSWARGSDPCAGGSFDGVACDGRGRVANISLQGKGLSGRIPPEIGGLESLSGLYLHFNALGGEIPKEIGGLRMLTDLYLDVNGFSGEIPPDIANLTNLQVLQLCYNRFSGSIPRQLGSLQKLSVLALQYNLLTGAIPASLGDLASLKRLDLSYNSFFGSIPARLANASNLEVLDVRNNTLSGFVPTGLKRLDDGFQYENNPDLCGVGFPNLRPCPTVYLDRPEPLGPDALSKKDIPESADLKSSCGKAHCPNRLSGRKASVVLGVVAVIAVIGFTVTGFLTFSWHQRRKQRTSSSLDVSDKPVSTDQVIENYAKSASPLISLEYSNGWDPLANGGGGSAFSQEVFESFMFNLEDVERATQSFLESNLLEKTSFSSVHRGILRDGSAVTVKRYAKMSCKSDEAEVLKGLKLLTKIKHEKLVRLRGFCCSKGRGECFLIYEFVPNGNLLQYLDTKPGSGKVLEWPTRVAIIVGVAQGISYIHEDKGDKPRLVHQSISAEKVLIDHWNNPLLSDSGLHHLLADDVVFAMLKASAAMGYLAPEYTSTGYFTEKSDVYAFGVLVLQILSGKAVITPAIRHGVEACCFEEFVDENLEGNFTETEATQLAWIALLCTRDSPTDRPSMRTVVQELNTLIGIS
ncbi:probable LRR receptor-like serine/threonine-protein kinase At4g36180 [Syzygium oleosum]|uniref:probable LRR receptor-like serine/threonine-protein kinase At4g36180 n=1 Tax=Syzygium oleosum TaxID=219896 RepID=UPI0011D1B242|nr:probable LRR receptor-like serine/threonine-protein kinase At4g36180 [Syzygium oleosum]